ncbi:MAG: sugar-binding domain-containing protein, partial [Vicinamibacteraceae bacterium]
MRKTFSGAIRCALAVGTVGIVASPLALFSTRADATLRTAQASSTAVSDPHGDHEPSETHVRSVDGTNVVFSYGEVTPSFDGWSRRESTRQYVSLDRAWRFRYDPENIGLASGWNLPGMDESAWDSIAVPSAWDLHGNDGWAGYDGEDFGKGGSLVDGYAWYRTSVLIPASWQHKHVRLAFLAASYSADVWVNGRFAGKHEGGQTAFALPVSAQLSSAEEATIAVRVYRRASFTSYDGTGERVSDPYALPPGVVDYWPYAGLTRSVWLEAVPRVTVAKVLLNASGGSLDARVVLENHGDRAFHGLVRVDPGSGSGGRMTTVEVSIP